VEAVIDGATAGDGIIRSTEQTQRGAEAADVSAGVQIRRPTEHALRRRSGVFVQLPGKPGGTFLIEGDGV
jgi:hypothetical protein